MWYMVPDTQQRIRYSIETDSVFHGMYDIIYT